MFLYKVDSEINLALLQPHHAEDIFKLVNENRDHLREWLGWVNGIKSSEDYKQTIIPIWLKQFADNNGFNTGIYYRGQLVGMISLQFINWKTKHTSIGYYISEAYQGKGIITRCVQAVIDYSFNELQLNKIEIQCATNNISSRKVPERLGFKLEGISREAEFINGHYNDIATYSILQKEWEK